MSSNFQVCCIHLKVLYNHMKIEVYYFCYAPARACGGRYAWFCGAGPGTARRRLTRVETDSDRARQPRTKQAECSPGPSQSWTR